jgi:periplasmic divalent cation tolerance protein
VYRIVTTTVDSQDEADSLAQSAVDARLAACAQQRAIRSTYVWNGALERSDEIAIDFKTKASRVDELVGFIERRHSYDCPEVVVVPVESGSAGYLGWVDEMTTDTDTR